MLNGEEIPSVTPEGEQIVDASFVVLFNAWREPVTFTLPPARVGRKWTHELCTSEPAKQTGAEEFSARSKVAVEARALRVLRRIG